MKTIHDYTLEIVETAINAAKIEPILKHKILRKVYKLKSYKDFKNRQLAEKKVLKERKPPAKIVFHNVPKPIQKVMILACEKNDIDLESFCSNTRKDDVVEAQRMVMYFLHKEIRYSSLKVGSWFMKDHSTILHSCGVHEQRIDTEKLYATIYKNFHEEALGIIFAT